MAYRGSTPSVRCRELSGADCNRPVPAGAENCGIAEHAIREPLGKAAGPGTFISNPLRRKPRLTVNEDFDLVEPDRDLSTDLAYPDLDPSSFDESLLWVGTQVQKEFTAHHGTDPHAAIEELRFFVREALARGAYRRADSGFHFLRYREFEVWISPDGKTVTGYSTFHYERTPTQVLGGFPSRFGSGHRGHHDRPFNESERLDFLTSLAPGETHDGTVSSIVNFGVFVNLGPMDGLLHILALPASPGVKPREMFHVGDEVTVRILHVDTDLLRISLMLAPDESTGTSDA